MVEAPGASYFATWLSWPIRTAVPERFIDETLVRAVSDVTRRPS